MKLLNKLTYKNLILNKKRSIVTIIGIILSVALITAVSSMVSSFRESMINYEKTVDDSRCCHFFLFLQGREKREYNHRRGDGC